MPRSSRAMSLSALVLDAHTPSSSSSTSSARTRSSTTNKKDQHTDSKQRHPSRAHTGAASTPVSPRASAALPLPIPSSFSTSSLALPSSGTSTAEHHHQSSTHVQSQAAQQLGKKSTNPLRSLLKKLRIDSADSLHSLAGAPQAGSENDSDLDFGCSGLGLEEQDDDDELRSLHEHEHDASTTTTTTTTSLASSRRPSIVDGELHISLQNVHSHLPPASSGPQSAGTTFSRGSQLQEHERASLQHELGIAGVKSKRSTNDSEQMSASFASLAAPTSPRSESQTLSPSTSSSSQRVLSPFTCTSGSIFTSISTSTSTSARTSMSTSTSVRGSTASSSRYSVSSPGTTSIAAAATSPLLSSSCISSAFTSATPSESAATTDSARSSFSSQTSNTLASDSSAASSTCSPTMHTSPRAAGFKHYTRCHAPASSAFVTASGKRQIHAPEMCACDEKDGFVVETEEQAALRRDQEEKAAIEALDAYFAVQTATATAAAVAAAHTSSATTTLSPTLAYSASAIATAHAAAPPITNRARSQSVPRKMRRESSPALKAVSPYFARYGDEPLPCLPSPFPNQHHHDHDQDQYQQELRQQQQGFQSLELAQPGSTTLAEASLYPEPPLIAATVSNAEGHAPAPPSLPGLRTRRSTTTLRELKAEAEARKEQDEEEDANSIAALDAYRFPARSNLVQGLPQPQFVKAPLGAATASRRGSLVASSSLPELIRAQSPNANLNTGSSSVLVRSRAGSLAATVNPAHRQAVYDFI